MCNSVKSTEIIFSEGGGSGSSNNGQGSSRPSTSYQGRSHSPSSTSKSNKGTALEGAIPKTSHIHNVTNDNDAHIANHSASLGKSFQISTG